MRGLHFGKGSKNEWFWRDIENITRKGDHGQEALWFPREMIDGSPLNATGGYAECGILECLKFLEP